MAGGHWYQGAWFGDGEGGSASCVGLEVPGLSITSAVGLATPTVTGGDDDATNTVSYQRAGSTPGAWTAAGSRTGQGVLDAIELAPGLYWWKLDSALDGCNVVPPIIAARVLGSPAAGTDWPRIREALRHWLLTEPDVAAMVGKRVYPNRVPQKEKTYPRIVYTKSSGDREYHLGGPDSLAHPTFDIACCAADPDTAEQLAMAIKGTEAVPRLDGFQGPLGPPSREVWVQFAHLVAERDQYIQLADGSDQGEHQVVLSFELWFEE